MGHFTYFVAGANAGSAEVFERAGIEHVWAASPEWTAPVTGPDQSRGVIARIAGKEDAGKRWGCDPARQTWVGPDQHGEGPFWIGYDTDRRPGPADLLRADALVGHGVTLGDGAEWVIPIAKMFFLGRAPVAKLRRAVITGEDGSERRVWIAGEAVERYRPLEKIAERIWERFSVSLLVAEKTGEPAVLLMDTDELAGIAIEALASNYHVGPAEVEVLELLDTTNVDAVARAIIDWPTVEAAIAFQKKTGALT